jgi:hypothetical protein
VRHSLLQHLQAQHSVPWTQLVTVRYNLQTVIDFLWYV